LGLFKFKFIIFVFSAVRLLNVYFQGVPDAQIVAYSTVSVQENTVSLKK